MKSGDRSDTTLDPSGRLCHVTEAADYLALSRSKVYELMDAGKLPYVKIDRSRRIEVAELRALVAANRVVR